MAQAYSPVDGCLSKEGDRQLAIAPTKVSAAPASATSHP
jgi:hypothetical protein